MADSALVAKKPSGPAYVREVPHQHQDFIRFQAAMLGLQECSDLPAGLAPEHLAGSQDEMIVDKFTGMRAWQPPLRFS